MQQTGLVGVNTFFFPFAERDIERRGDALLSTLKESVWDNDTSNTTS